ncbi:hypothetical protein [Yersinia intermedia]|uniref:hypothetical protein n=1 Tax=Yersinia intermedia TaxID=631 RepID=UPI00119FA6CE|nr:hypothetical protein [Yersinia intermedia]
MLSMKVKTIIAAIIAIIIVALIWFFLPQEKAPEAPPKGNTLYVQSSLPGECRAIITPILDGIKSVSSEIPCQVQLRSKK